MPTFITTVKPVLRDHCQKVSPVLTDHHLQTQRLPPIPKQFKLSPQTMIWDWFVGKKSFLSPLAILSMEKKKVAKLICELTSVSRLKIFPETGLSV